MNCAAPPASTTTRYSAACTTFFVLTTPSAEITIAAASTPKKTFSAIMSGRARCGRRYAARGRSPLLRARSAALRSPPRDSLLALDVGAELERLRLGDALHPLAELLLVVQELGDARLGVLELGAPE